MSHGPSGGVRLNVPHHVGQRQRGGELREQMDVGVISVRVFVSRLLGTRIHTQLPRFYAPDLNRTS